ncbi:enoyl-CoA hydratase/isomerase family protein [Polluticaenibacter yanchengensis]|uniref:Enoyl-CoA hydratase-related protein n=1 Tax=Polluticaenibacter yanchengensis TaxID=3014562 RepID=A0ABT4UPQ2_9BACT|nr:enoyl-CoA hydratase-related protein [Chitinophagaceae bacterium LY-5]
MYENLLTNESNGIYTITINRPTKLNALNSQVITELGEAILEIYNNPAIKSAIITGIGEKAFAAGADISEFTELDGEGGKQLALRGQQLVFSKIENCPKPIVAAVNGFALGGGCELAMACHFRIASNNAKFGQPEVNLGLIPGYGGTQRLTHLVGKGRAIELLITGNMIDADEAYRIGLVNKVTELSDLIPTAEKILGAVNKKAPLAVSKCLTLANIAVSKPLVGLEQEIQEFGNLFDTKDAKEGAAAFLEKRPANFIGE